MLTDAGQVAAERRALGVEGNGKRGQAGLAAARQGDGNEPARGEQVRVVEQLDRPGDRGIRQAELLQSADQLGARVLAQGRGDDGYDAGPRGDAMACDASAGSASSSCRPKASQNSRHCVSVTTPTKSCPPSAVSKMS